MKMNGNNIPVYMKVYDREDDDSDALCEIQVGADAMTLRGDAQMMVDLISGLSHLFVLDAHPDVTSHFDFLGSIDLVNGRAPSAEIRLGRLVGKDRINSSVFLRIGEKSMQYGCRDWSTANNVAQGFVALFGLKAADRSGKRYVGRVDVAQEELQAYNDSLEPRVKNGARSGIQQWALNPTPIKTSSSGQRRLLVELEDAIDELKTNI